MPSPAHIEILDLRHFAAEQLRPLLTDQARRWDQRLRWDYSQSAELLLEYIGNRVLPGYVAVRDRAVIGYTFCVFEAAKAVIGDAYAFGEGESLENPVCDTLLTHLIETLQATPGMERIESQLLMFPSGALPPFHNKGFLAIPRLFMGLPLASAAAEPRPETRLPEGLRLIPWHDRFYDAAANLIHRAYATHIDSRINDQYTTVHGSLRFLHNIVRFPGCGTFDPVNSWVLARPASAGQIEGLLLCSQVRRDIGHITQLCVSPALRGFGLGRALLQRCAAEFHRRAFHGISLTVTEANLEARRLYEDFGFTALHHFEAMVCDLKQR